MSNALLKPVTSTALGLIWVYQRWISPRKGYRCAHAVLHGGTGCSGFAKQAIREQGIWPALRVIRQRFRDCRAALIVLNGEQELRNRQRKDRGKSTWWDAACVPCDCASCASSKSSAAGAGATAGAEAATGMCGAVGEGIGGAAGGCAGGISCCG